ncbi:MFS transporter [Pseudonocardia halophobica]|uniref:MFS transporter n=1 Tax=Pseudonocardia halophobica TaxID=29401 RepID=UPI0018CC5B15|nr:MFS transporter [Pseudonocardia halophobica]
MLSVLSIPRTRSRQDVDIPSSRPTESDLTEHAHNAAGTQGDRPVHPRDLILDSPMSGAQKRAVALAAVISALDGFDLLSVTFVAPALARAFQVDSAAIGILLSAGLVGALLGSITLAPLADIVGRRPIVLASLTVMVVGMLLSALCDSVFLLAIVRVLTGVGIGAMMVVVNPAAVEVANRRTRSLAIAMLAVGYPLGGALGGLASAFLLRHVSWHSVFLLGAVLTLLVVPFAAKALPESLAFLLARRRADSLGRVNSLLRRFGHTALAALPPVEQRRRTPYREIVRGRQLLTTVQVCVISLLLYMTIYFFLSWQPTMLVSAGFDASAAASVASAGSFLGAFVCAVFGLLSRRVDGRLLAAVGIFGLGILVIAFGLVPSVPVLVILTGVLAASSVAAGTLGLMITTADAFAAPIRATGTGVVLGIGRIGSAAAPALAGALFAAGGGRTEIAVVMGSLAVVSGLVLLTVRRGARRDS